MSDAGSSLSEPVEVLLVADDDSYDRMGSIIQHLCVGAIDDPVRLRVLLRTNRPNVPESIGPAQVLTVPRRSWPWDRNWPEAVLERIEDGTPAIVHCMSARLCRWAWRITRLCKCRLIAHLTDLADMGRLHRLMSDPSLLGIAATSRLYEVMARRWPGLRDRVRMIPFGVPAIDEPACLDDPERVPSAIVSTPLSRDCGLPVVLGALRTIITGGQEVQLFVLSGGRAESNLRRQVDRLNLRGYVTFAGSMSDWETVSAAMSGADFFIEPNPHRRFSAHTLTAMANGLAILAPHGTLEDYLIDGTTARLFDAGRPAVLAEKWSQLLADRSAARLLGQSALDYARAYHQATRMVAATVGLYHDAQL